MALLDLQPPKNITYYKIDCFGNKSYRRIDNVIDITPEKALSILTLETDAGYSDEIIYACYKHLLDSNILKFIRNHDWKRPLYAKALELRRKGII
jgi:hypothetical protein